MPKKKQITKKRRVAKSAPSRPTHEALTLLQRRVAALEVNAKEMKDDMGKLSTDLGELRVSIRHVDDRSIRGEKLMLSMQLEQRRQSRTLDRIAGALHVEVDPSPTPPDRPFSIIPLPTRTLPDDK